MATRPAPMSSENCTLIWPTCWPGYRPSWWTTPRIMLLLAVIVMAGLASLYVAVLGASWYTNQRRRQMAIALSQQMRHITASLQATADLDATLSASIADAVNQLPEATVSTGPQLMDYLNAESQRLACVKKEIRLLKLAKVQLNGLSARFKTAQHSRVSMLTERTFWKELNTITSSVSVRNSQVLTTRQEAEAAVRMALEMTRDKK